MIKELDIKWDLIAKIKNHSKVPCLRFVAGAQTPILTWLLPSRDPIWTMYIAGYNPGTQHFELPEKLMFQYIRARDIGVYVPGITPSMQIVQTLDGSYILIGVRKVDFNKGSFFSASVMRPQIEHPIETEELQDADYTLRSYGGSWESVQDVSKELFSQFPDALALGQTGVYDIRVFSGKNAIFVIGSTWDAKLWFSVSSDGGGTWKAPIIIAQNGIHPTLTEMPDGQLVTFYIKADSQIKARKDGDKITVSPTTGPLWFIERNRMGKWNHPRVFLDRSDILHCSACSNSEGHLCVAFDVYPEEPSPVIWGQDALFSGSPSSQVYITGSSDSGKTWREFVSVSDVKASYFSSEITFYQNNVILSAIRRESKGFSVVYTVVPMKDLIK